jgi:hypothetical protein
MQLAHNHTKKGVSFQTWAIERTTTHFFDQTRKRWDGHRWQSEFLFSQGQFENLWRCERHQVEAELPARGKAARLLPRARWVLQTLHALLGAFRPWGATLANRPEKLHKSYTIFFYLAPFLAIFCHAV